MRNRTQGKIPFVHLTVCPDKPPCSAGYRCPKEIKPAGTNPRVVFELGLFDQTKRRLRERTTEKKKSHSTAGKSRKKKPTVCTDGCLSNFFSLYLSDSIALSFASGASAFTLYRCSLYHINKRCLSFLRGSVWVIFISFC